MSNLFYSKLALNNIKKNSKTYFPYILTCIGTISMYYIMYALSLNKGLDKVPGSDALKTILFLGTCVIGFFSIIFLFYTNSFLTKRRKKEFGLFNILGMEKKHISKMLFLETIYVLIFSLITGILSGVILNKLIYLFLLKILNFNVQMGFEMPLKAILSTVVLFSIIFALIFLNTLRQVHLTNPIELLKGSETGEREPKTKWIIAVIGTICLASGYYMSLSIKNPLDAVNLFFIAVILVIIGTYFLFIAGSIVVLKALKKNKKYYYKLNHFTSVSGMIYRMKQNAAGLASICILSTCVLVMLSTTVSMYAGMEDVLRTRFERNIIVNAQNVSKEDISKINNIIDEESGKEHAKINNVVKYRSMDFAFAQNGNKFEGKSSQIINPTNSNAAHVHLIPLDEYNIMQNTKAALNNNEVLLYTIRGDIAGDTLNINNTKFNIKDRLDTLSIGSSQLAYMINTYYIVVKDENTISDIYKTYYKNTSTPELSYYCGFDLDENSEKQIKLTNNIEKRLKSSGLEYHIEGAEESRQDFYSLYGGLLFIGIFLGLLFIMATVLIIYYKQISEGFDDKKRFEIMQKVGMDKTEIKKSIKSQVLTVFFLPLVTAAIHIIFAFNMISKLLTALNLTNTTLFAWCCVFTILVFTIFYSIIYTLTAKVYYKIVS